MADRPKGYGLTAELQNKMEGKYDENMDLQARQWIEAVLGERLASHDGPLCSHGFHEVLKDGVILCRLMNNLDPSLALKFNQSKMAFKMMENIAKFLSAAEKYGVGKTDLFQTVDLYEAQNIPQVISSIHALGRKAQQRGFLGPVLGPKESASSKRNFSEEQLRAGQGIIGLQAGSNKGASQAGQSFGKGRDIISHAVGKGEYQNM